MNRLLKIFPAVQLFRWVTYNGILLEEHRHITTVVWKRFDTQKVLGFSETSCSTGVPFSHKSLFGEKLLLRIQKYAINVERYCI